MFQIPNTQLRLSFLSIMFLLPFFFFFQVFLKTCTIMQNLLEFRISKPMPNGNSSSCFQKQENIAQSYQNPKANIILCYLPGPTWIKTEHI